MKEIPRRYKVRAFIAWLPFPCLFLPLNIFPEDGASWYSGYLPFLFILAAFFYLPATLLVGIPWFLEGEYPPQSVMFPTFFVYSLVVSLAFL